MMEIDDFNLEFYKTVVDAFIEKGETPNTEPFVDHEIENPKNEYERYLVNVCRKDPLLEYLAKQMEEPFIQYQVLTNYVCARVFRDMAYDIISMYCKKKQFNLKCNQAILNDIDQARQWSTHRKETGWQSLLAKASMSDGEGMLSSTYSALFSSEDLWASMKQKPTNPLHSSDDAAKKAKDVWNDFLDQWQENLELLIDKKTAEQASTRMKNMEKIIQNNLRQIPDYQKTHKIEEKDLLQTWGMMKGIWNEYQFEKLFHIVSLQQKYPDIRRIADIMGRVADGMGTETARISWGENQHLQHSTKSDIMGVSIGNDISALLPTELALCIDNEIDGIFNYRYHNRQLQTFSYRSDSEESKRTLKKQRAKTCGPMIVCVDFSRSMEGKPIQIAISTLMYLLELTERTKRELYLIAFSVFAHPIDVSKEREKILELLSSQPSGSTLADHMLKETLDTIEDKSRYANADVLWITDFKMELAKSPLLNDMELLRNDGTHFYGLQIGTADHDWSSYFDEIAILEYKPRMKY